MFCSFRTRITQRERELRDIQALLDTGRRRSKLDQGVRTFEQKILEVRNA